MFKKIGVAVVVLFLSTGVFAKDVSSEKQASLKAMVGGLFKSVGKPSGIVYSALPGFVEMYYAGSVIYVSEDERFLIVNGSVIDAKLRKNLTKESEAIAELGLRPLRQQAINSIPEEDMIIFKSPKEKHVVTVFTDIDCGYCRKLHNEMSQYLENGITVRYLFFPRAGVGSGSYQKAVSVWCADDRIKAITASKNGQRLPVKSCKHPIDGHMEVVEALGLSGTPAIITSSGELLGGYVKAGPLARALNQQ
ncbi:MAG: DsbC family protein [Methylococcales bacterium]|jgi:thiol:disulfide interchange protein DsbC|nr:DsbC family protein [Methylococcales bacterium]MBT7442675.1 DsbC family protein [Methylococcales bacterium]